jgi:hypothetical protein
MIDRDRQQPSPGTLRPHGRDPQQGHGVTAPGQGQGDGMIDVGLKSRLQSLRDPAFQPDRVGRDQRQAARVRVSAAMARRAGVEVRS